MIHIDNKLREREAEGRPIRVGVVGAGEMAAGLVNQIERHVPGMRVAGMYNRTADRIHRVYAAAGVETCVAAETPGEAADAVAAGRAFAAATPEVLVEAAGIDVIVEITGTLGFAFDVIGKAFSAGKHVVSFNAELDATVGPWLQRAAGAAGVRYTLGDGDQPGVTLNLYRRVEAMGFRPLVCGNIKGMLDHYRTPETQRGFAEASGMDVRMVTSFADGTKVSLEQASIANATGMGVARRGMLAMESTDHVDTLTDAFDHELLEARGGIVDMVIGAKPGPGVFVFATTDDPVSRRLLEYGKLGKGPLYSFYEPYHLLVLAFPFSIARLVDFADGTLDARDRMSVEVVALAKRDLAAGETLDGIGGFTFYGACENRPEVVAENLLPAGLAEGRDALENAYRELT